MSNNIRALEFYSGIGGLHLALKRSGIGGTILRAFDYDQLACKVYACNHGRDTVHQVDITSLTAESLLKYDSNTWLLSPACQPYTVLNPAAKGAADPRAQSFLYLIQEVLPDLALCGEAPSYIFVENVAGFETSATRTALLNTLNRLEYHIMELLLTPLQFGVPNSRLRYYLLARNSRPFPVENQSGRNCLWRHLPGQGSDWTDERDNADPNIRPLRVFLDADNARDVEGDQRHSNAVPNRVLEKWGRLFDIVRPSERRSCCFTRGYGQLVERAGSIVQTNETLDTTETFDAFLAAQASGDPHAVELLRPLGLRYFSPNELLRLFCFDDILPPHPLSGGKEYREGGEGAAFMCRVCGIATVQFQVAAGQSREAWRCLSGAGSARNGLDLSV